MREDPRDPSKDAERIAEPGTGPTPPGAQPGKPADQELLDHLRRQRQGRLAKVIVALTLIVLLIIFIIANSQPVKVNFVFVSRHPRLIWVMLGCAVVGGIAGYLIGRPGRQLPFRRHRDEPTKDEGRERR